MPVRSQAKKVLTALLITISFLLIAHLVSQFVIFHHDLEPHRLRTQLLWLFNLNEERSIGTWYSVVTLFTAAALAIIIGIMRKQHGKPWGIWWIILGCVFAYLSIDEAISIHEMLMYPVKDTLGIGSGALYYAWVIPVGVATLLFAIIYLRFWIALPSKTRNLFLLSAIIYIGGAIGMEMIASYQQTSVLVTDTAITAARPLFVVFWGIEEFLEMLGVALFIYALLDYLTHQKTSHRSPKKVATSTTITT